MKQFCNSSRRGGFSLRSEVLEETYIKGDLYEKEISHGIIFHRDSGMGSGGKYGSGQSR